ncbi:hypothetical protein NE237_000483 [Protea cynaroides]|uniref:Uncharacterized protein n=1 Tax=Protea cynaroides TaxID=273540 RepID=A0A9Q0KRJ4_9MAGN|nr:hypothetical protein NE237_000483 [Protea cynaroides]
MSSKCVKETEEDEDEKQNVVRDQEHRLTGMAEDPSTITRRESEDSLLELNFLEAFPPLPSEVVEDDINGDGSRQNLSERPITKPWSHTLIGSVSTQKSIPLDLHLVPLTREGDVVLGRCPVEVVEDGLKEFGEYPCWVLHQ